MNLANILKRNDTNIRGSESVKASEAMSKGERNYRVQNEIRNLIPGQTIRGEVVARNGNSVQLALANDMLINARIDQSISIALGQNMSFEVKANNGSMLSLSPLYANMANEATILRALTAAGLPETADNIMMVAKMMEEGMPIDKESIIAMSRQLLEFPTANPATIIQMTRLEIPVTQANIEQFEHYMNANHQILGSVEDIMNGLPQVFLELMGEGKADTAYAFYEAVINLFTEESTLDEEGSVIAKGPSEQIDGQQTAEQQAAGALQKEGAEQTTLTGTAANAAQEIMLQEEAQQLPGGSAQAGVQGQAKLSAENWNTLSDMLKELGVKEETAEQVKNGELSAKEVLNLVKNLLAKESAGQLPGGALARLLGSKEFQGLLRSEIENQWLIRPEDVARPEKTEQLYEKIREQSARLNEAVQNAGKMDLSVAKSVQNLQNNVDFMNQLNHTFTYIQLPLKMMGNNAHGDLYVYTNKKHLAAKDGNVSALLHLDMEHLGPLDVYVTMQQSKVNTNFTLRDESSLDLIAEHIHLLDERLAKRGYDLKAQFQVKEDTKQDETNNIMQMILNQDKNISVLSRTSFDMRA